MKKAYLKPELEIVKFDFDADLLYASGPEETIYVPGPSDVTEIDPGTIPGPRD